MQVATGKFIDHVEYSKVTKTIRQDNMIKYIF